MVRPFLFALLPLGLLACGGSDTDSTAVDPVFLSLDDAADGTSATTDGTDQSGPVEADLAAAEGAGSQAQPASASLDAADALAALADWHRATAAKRSQLLRGPSAAVAGMQSLALVWSGEADTYRAALKTTSESAFGVHFARFSAAWAEHGTTGLQTALAEGPVGSVAHLVWTDVLVETSFAKDAYRSGGIALSSLLDGMLESGYSRERVLELVSRIALVGRNASTFLAAEDYKVQSGDSYWVLCRDLRRKGLLVNQGWLADFNQKRNYTLRQGESLRIPQAKLSVHAWRAKRLMAIYADGIPIRLYPVSMGGVESPTPLGSFTLGICEPEPVFYPQGERPVPFGNPDNPLGERWLGFQEDRQYGIHGTNSEDTIGSYESGGCIRMHNSDVLEFFELLCPGIPVTVSA